MNALILIAWITCPNRLENWTFAIVDALERALTAKNYMVGSIYIVGNQRVTDGMILDRLPICNAGPLSNWRLRLGEIRLASTGLFKIDLLHGVWPRVTALKAKDREFRDVRVDVVEK